MAYAQSWPFFERTAISGARSTLAMNCGRHEVRRCPVAMAAEAASVPLARQLSRTTGHVCFTLLKMG